jgi:hypothetical protein
MCSCPAARYAAHEPTAPTRRDIRHYPVPSQAHTCMIAIIQTGSEYEAQSRDPSSSSSSRGLKVASWQPILILTRAWTGALTGPSKLMWGDEREATGPALCYFLRLLPSPTLLCFPNITDDLSRTPFYTYCTSCLLALQFSFSFSYIAFNYPLRAQTRI